jgi:hypothetical protein
MRSRPLAFFMAFGLQKKRENIFFHFFPFCWEKTSPLLEEKKEMKFIIFRTQLFDLRAISGHISTLHCF